jgi:hypothetical protein
MVDTTATIDSSGAAPPGGRAGAPEIEITPAMIEAGFEALLKTCALEHPCEGDRYIVERVFSAMISASSFATKAHEPGRAA